VATAIVAAAVVLAFVVEQLLPHGNLSLLFLTGVLIVAARAGLGPSLLASLLSLLAYAFFFTPPYHSFGVAADSDAATLAFFLIVAAATGHLAARMHREMAGNRASLARLSKLYAFGARLSSAADTEAVIDALTYHLERSLGEPVAVALAEGDDPTALRPRPGTAGGPSDAELAQAWADPSPGGSTGGNWLFLPLRTNRGALGLVAIESRQTDLEQIDLARSLCDQAALALDRVRLVTDVEQAKRDTEAAQLRSALLSSVSHDLRTPLAAIIGSATSLQEYGEAISREDRGELLASVVEEARRLDRYIQNLLDMTRLGQGKLPLRRDWVDINDIVASALGRIGAPADGVRVDIQIEPDLPLLWVQGALIEQALVNLLDNAVRFSPAGGTVEVAARSEGDAVAIEVCDEGSGIPEADRETVFEMFYTLPQSERSDLQGTGLGLAICRGILTAHGGTISAHPGRRGSGTCMRLWLPAPRADRTPEET